MMYNHLTNDWGDKEHEIPFDISRSGHPEVRVRHVRAAA